MKITARTSFVHFSPRKLRLIADSVRNMPPLDAINYLKNMPHKAAQAILKVYQQAFGNAKDAKLSPESLVVNTLQIEGGPEGFKKADVHSHGARFDRGVRQKKMAHIRLELVNGGGK
jgi:ribosomal protein L22